MKVERISWPLDVPPKLLKACGDSFATIRNQVQDGEAHLYRIHDDSAEVLVVTRVEAFPHGVEMVIVCAAGHGMAKVGQLLIDNARLLSCDCIRYHGSEATHRLYTSYGFGGKEVERVYKVALGGY